MSTDTKPKLTIDDLLQEATKLVRDKIPDGLAATMHVYNYESYVTGQSGGAQRSHSFTIDMQIDGTIISGTAVKTMAQAISLAHKAIEKYLSDREAARIERERAEFDAANVPDRFEASGIA